MKGTGALNKILAEVQDMSPEEYMELYNQDSKKESLDFLDKLIKETRDMSQEEFDKRDRETKYSN